MASNSRLRKSDRADLEPKSATFSVSAALFEELGERLVSKPEIALAELIKNAYDADSPDCELTINSDQITVADHGHGMTEKEFLGNWMVVSTQKKGLLRFSRKHGRSMAGSKGVGRFSARFLGYVVRVTTVAEEPKKAGARTRLVATFDWRKISAIKTINQVTISYTVEKVGVDVPLGTALRITELREEARAISISKVKTDILQLTDPAAGLEKPSFVYSASEIGRTIESDPGFSVSFTDSVDGDPDAVSPTVAAQILDAFVGRVRIRVTESGKLTYKVFWNRGESPIAEGKLSLASVAAPYSEEALKTSDLQKRDTRGLPADVKDIPHLPLAARLHSPVFIDVRFFPRRQGTFSNLGVDGTKALGWLSRSASVAIVDNSFAMPAYADRDSDWLGIDASKARNERDWQSIFMPELYPMSATVKNDPALNPMLALPRGTQLIGRIHIATRKRPPGVGGADEWLYPNMDRESLRSNGAFRLLWHVSRFAVELLAHFDRTERLKEERKQRRERERRARSALTAAIQEVRSSKDIEPAHRRRIVNQLVEVQEHYREAADYAESARASLELMSMMGVMAGFMTHEFEKTLGSLKSAADLLDQLASKSKHLGDSAATLRKNELALANYLDYMKLFISKARDPQPQSFKAKSQISLATKTLSSLASDYGIRVDLDIDSKLLGPFVPLAAYNGIVINLLSNAMKALIPKLSDQQRKVRFYAANDGKWHTLVCADNGIGIPDYMRRRIWDPLFTTTAGDDNPMGSGLGLGLSLVRQVVQRLNGRIELLDSAPPGYSTAFRVSLPMNHAGE